MEGSEAEHGEDRDGAGIVIEFIDERFEHEPGADITFGRSGDVVIDEANTFMNRIVGVFVHHAGSWWVQNRSSTSELTLIGDRGVRTVLPPNSSDPVVAPRGVVRFSAGRLSYELGWELESTQRPPLRPSQPDTGTVEGRRTQDFGIVPLNTEQRAMLALFAHDWLDSTADADRREVPANSDVAHRLGWSLKKLDRKLDYLCARLDEAGVPGLRGAKGGEATDRRRRLVEHVVSVGLITPDDLA